MQQKKAFKMPNILVIIFGLIVLASILTYIVPAGVYDIAPETNRVIAGSFHYVDRNPVTLWSALLMLQQGIINSASVISLMLVVGGAIHVMLSTGAVESVLNYAVYRLRDKSVPILVPSVVVLMSLLGAFAGNDSMMVFVTVGVVFCKKLKLDRLVACGMFYLSYITGQACGPTTLIIMTAQTMADVQPVSGILMRMLIWAILTTISAVYTTRYALKIQKDPSRSIMGEILTPDQNTEEDVGSSKLPLRSAAVVLLLFASFIIYAIGASKAGWGYNYLLAIMVVASILAAILYRISPSKLAATYLEGAKSMGGICLILGLAKIVGSVLTTGNIMHTIAYAAVSLIGKLGATFSAAGMFIFTLLFNLLIPSGTSKAAIVMPVLTPMADVLGMTRQVLCTAYQLGDGLSNTLTPVSSVLVGVLSLSGVSYNKWLKYILPVFFINVVVSIVIIVSLQGIGWVG